MNADYDSIEKSVGLGVASSASPHPYPEASARDTGSAYSRHHRHDSHSKPLTQPAFFDSSSSSSSKDKPPRRIDSMSPKSIGRAIGARIVRGVKRGNLPFMLVFTIALLVFIGALAGVGYVDPGAAPAAAAAAKAPAEGERAGEQEFEPGKPVFDSREAQAELERAMQAQRALEAQWRRAARPNAGAWMRDHRDDGSRRQAEISPEEAAAIAAKDEEKLRLYERNRLRSLEGRRSDLLADERELLADAKANQALMTALHQLQKAADASYAEAVARAEAGTETAPKAAVTVLINPKTGEHDERLGLGAAEIRSRDRDLQNRIEKVRESIADLDGQLGELRRRYPDLE